MMPFSNLRKFPAAFLTPLALVSALLLAGCDEHVTVIRDKSVHIQNGNTWAWREAASTGNRVISRDVIGQNALIDNDEVRARIKTSIEHDLSAKGLHQVADAQAADFLVDYHVGVRGRNVTLEHIQPGRYPVLVCGFAGCWDTWSWGYWGPPEVSYQTIHYREGTIVFDLTKRSTNHLAFRAIGQKEIHGNSFSQEHVAEAVHRLLKDLKPGK